MAKIHAIERECTHCDVCKWFEAKRPVPVVERSVAVGRPAKKKPVHKKRGGKRQRTNPNLLDSRIDEDVVLARAILTRRQKAGKLTPDQNTLFDSLKGKFVKKMEPSERDQILELLKDVG